MSEFGLMCRARSTTVLAHVFMARQNGEGLRRSKRHSRSSLTPLTTEPVRSVQNSVKAADCFYVFYVAVLDLIFFLQASLTESHAAQALIYAPEVHGSQSAEGSREFP